MNSRRPAYVLILGLNLSLSACGSDGAGTERTPRIHTAGGAPGASSGGANATPSGGSGGTRNTGFGGAIASGGAVGVGGKGNGGTGGSPSGGGSGGSVASGGSLASGGSTASGNTASGGSTASGGNSNLPGTCSALFCEDFETGMLASRWTTETDGGMVSVGADPLAHGNYAVRFHLNANGRQAVITMDAPSALGRHAFGRSVFHVTSPTDKPASAAHTVYFTAGDGLNEKHYELGGYDTSWQTSYWYPGGENIAAGGKVPVNTSVCLEWEFDDAPSGVVRVWIDGVQNDEFTDAGGGNKLTAFTKLSFGIKFFQPVPNAVDLTLDDIAFDTKRVGCSF